MHGDVALVERGMNSPPMREAAHAAHDDQHEAPVATTTTRRRIARSSTGA